MTQVLRLAKTTDRVTQGRRYDLDDLGYIVDDIGRKMKVCLVKPGYWEVEESRTHTNCRCETVSIEAGSIVSPAVIWNNLTMKKSTSLEITKATYINGQNVNELTSDYIISLIQAEEAKKKTLSELPQAVIDKSKAVKALIIKHAENISNLIDILDSQHDTAQ